jgi:hypothetical protein
MDLIKQFKMGTKIAQLKILSQNNCLYLNVRTIHIVIHFDHILLLKYKDKY